MIAPGRCCLLNRSWKALWFTKELCIIQQHGHPLEKDVERDWLNTFKGPLKGLCCGGSKANIFCQCHCFSGIITSGTLLDGEDFFFILDTPTPGINGNHVRACCDQFANYFVIKSITSSQNWTPGYWCRAPIWEGVWPSLFYMVVFSLYNQRMWTGSLGEGAYIMHARPLCFLATYSC